LLRKTHAIEAFVGLERPAPEPLRVSETYGFSDEDTLAGASGSRPKVVLNVGCGYPGQGLHSSFHDDEWRELRLDIDPSVGPDIVCSMVEMTPIATASVDAIWSSHNLEHLHRHEVPLALGEFLRVLRPGGLLLLTLPDLQKVAELVAADGLEDEAYRSPSGPISPLDMMYGHSAAIAGGNVHMAHKTGFTARTLQQLLTASGFVTVALTREGFARWARAHKPMP
jgi:SAM-dependent methyltransferase